MGGSVEQQGHLAGTLDFGGQSALMLGAGAGNATGDNLAAFGDEIAEDVGTLVIKSQFGVGAEAAELATRSKLLTESHYATSSVASTESASLTVMNLNTPSVMRMMRSSSATS